MHSAQESNVATLQKEGIHFFCLALIQLELVPAHDVPDHFSLAALGSTRALAFSVRLVLPAEAGSLCTPRAEPLGIALPDACNTALTVALEWHTVQQVINPCQISFAILDYLPNFLHYFKKKEHHVGVLLTTVHKKNLGRADILTSFIFLSGTQQGFPFLPSINTY